MQKASTTCRGLIKSKSGMTLVETMVAVSILAIGLSGIFKLIVMTMKLSDTAREENTAFQLARNRLERMSMSNFNDLPMWSSSNLICDISGKADPNGSYTITTLVTFPTTNLAEVVVQVSARNRISLKFDKPAKSLSTYMTTGL